MIKTLFEKCIDKFMLPRVYGLAAGVYSRWCWKQSFRAAAALTPEIPAGLAARLSRADALCVYRFLGNTFKPEKRFPTAKDFAFAVGYELRLDCVDLEPHVIRKFAVNARREWCKALNSRTLLKYYLKERRDIHPASLINTDASCGDDLDPVLRDGVALRCALFESYSEPAGEDEARVWLPDEHGTVEKSEERRITVSVMLHSAQGTDLGFFRVCNDYSLVRGGKDIWLTRCFHNEKLGAETAEFQGYNLGDTNAPVLWML